MSPKNRNRIVAALKALGILIFASLFVALTGRIAEKIPEGTKAGIGYVAITFAVLVLYGSFRSHQDK